jgi:hypothetical protein
MPTRQQRPGPRPQGYVDLHIDVPARMRQWLKSQPGGASHTIRELVQRAMHKAREKPRDTGHAEGIQAAMGENGT